MLEIVFSDSACGSIKAAQHYGKGTYPGAAIGVLLRRKEDATPTAEEMQKAQLCAERDARQAWKNAIALSGNHGDVYCFDMALSIGDLSDHGLGERRKSVLRSMLSVCPFGDPEYQIEEKMQKWQNGLSSVLQRYTNGEELRIWYSHNPDELCGMHWLMAQLRPCDCPTAIYLVPLPVWESGKENTTISRNAWGDVRPGEWGKYASYQEKCSPARISAYAMKWRQLEEENAPLRAALNGQL